MAASSNHAGPVTRAAAIASVVFASGCVPQSELGSPISTDGAGLLAVVESDRITPDLYAVERASELPPIVARDGDTLVLLPLTQGLEAYGLAPGLVPTESFRRGRPLPPSTGAFSLVAPDVTWTPLDVLPVTVGELRLPALAQCSQEDRCGIYEDAETVCVRPCPRPTPVEPPISPGAPQIRNLACPLGWSPSDSSGPGCRPATRTVCPPGQIQVLGEQACAPLVPCDPGFRQPPEGSVLFLSAEAAPGGDGSEANPFRTLTEAIEADPDASLSLAPGDYVLPSAVEGRTAILGRCPEGVVLRGSSRIEPSGMLALDGVRLDGELVVAGELVTQNAELIQDLILQGQGLMRVGRSRVYGEIRNDGSQSTAWAVINNSVLEGGLHISGSVRVTGQNVVFENGTRYLTLSDRSEVRLVTVWLRAKEPSPALTLADDSAVSAEALFAEAESLFVLGEGTQLELINSGVSGLTRSQAVQGGLSAMGSHIAAVRSANPTFSVAGGQLSLNGCTVATRGSIFASALDSEVQLTDVEALGPELLIRARGESTVDVVRVASSGGLEIGAGRGAGHHFAYESGRRYCVNGQPDVHHQISLNVVDFRAEGRIDAGVILCAGTQATLQRVELQGVEAGVYADCRRGCELDLDKVDATITDLTVAGSTTSRFGVIQRGGTLRLERAELSGFETYGLYNWGSTVDVSDLVVRDIGRPGMNGETKVDTFCSQSDPGMLRGPGSAVFSENFSVPPPNLPPRLKMERFKLVDAFCAGVSFGFDGRLEGGDGEIRGHRRGFNVMRLLNISVTSDVVFRDNQTDLLEVLKTSGG